MKECPICGVKIDGPIVYYSVGKHSNKETLYKKVCQYNKKSGCLNRIEQPEIVVERQLVDLPPISNYLELAREVLRSSND